ncbi:Mg/Co/Ni transporter MgtE / CBS domain [Pseudoalteromonas luteoviolacea B = ATCC 29581]|nr:Mg/Co/Ni transporter MgtE / CBS domain [Pseudoalteromonas luteoviolacea B = ATCC 29581]
MHEDQVDQLSQLIDALLQCESEEQSRELLLDAKEKFSMDYLALLFEAIPKQRRMEIWPLLDEDQQHEIFVNLGHETCNWLLDHLDESAVYQLLQEINVEELLELEEVIPERFVEYAKAQLSESQIKQYETAQHYDAEQVGHWIGFDHLKVSEKLTMASVKARLKRGLPAYTDVIYTETRQGFLCGEVTINAILAAEENVKLRELIEPELVTLSATDDLIEAAEKVILSGKMALPVVNEQNKLIGRLTIASAYEIKQESQDDAAAKAGGLTEDEDLFSSVKTSAKNRGIWLGINLATAFLASWFIGIFEGTIEKVVALAVLMPVVASMGGIAGSQTLTVIVRGLALGQVTTANRSALLNKELKVGAVNGVVWASIIGLLTYMWFDDTMLSITIAIAILLNLLAASISGVIIPSILDRFNIDPALSGSVILTTVTDVVGFVTFLGLGSLLLLS